MLSNPDFTLEGSLRETKGNFLFIHVRNKLFFFLTPIFISVTVSPRGGNRYLYQQSTFPLKDWYWPPLYSIVKPEGKTIAKCYYQDKIDIYYTYFTVKIPFLENSSQEN